MKIGIHKGKGFSKWWIAYCEEKGIAYKIVDCYQSDIIQQLSDCDGLMWHFFQDNYRDMLFAKQLIFSVEAAGKKVFPDFNTCWHFDDKVGQKYLLEAIGAAMPASYVFYDKASAFQWIEKTSFPKVFKLRGGAASANVKLVKSKKDARKMVRRAFGKGFPQFNRIENLKERIRKFREGKDSFLGLLKGFGRLFIPTEFARMRNNEKGYVYFQDFISDNSFDTRIYVINNKAFATIRYNRKNDFRASGSGLKSLNPNLVSKDAIIEAFRISEKLSLQCCAYDFVMKDNKPKLLEISYGFGGRENKGGYWDRDLCWHEGRFNPYGWMVDQIVNGK